MSPEPVDVLSAADPVAAVLSAHAGRRPIAVRTSGTSARPRRVVRSTASWVDSFPAVSELTGIGPGSRVWLPGPLSASMNLFAAVHARFTGAEVGPTPDRATHACLTPTALAGALEDGVDLAGVHVVVAGDRLGRDRSGRAAAAGARTSHYYGAAELSFVAWGSDEDDLRPFPGVEVDIRDGVVWARSPYLALGYLEDGGPLRVAEDGFATVGDRGRLDDGVLTVLGRGTDAVLTGGVTVLVDDVEQALRRATGTEVVVVGLPHARFGQLVAAVLTDRTAVPAARAAAGELPPPQRPRRWFCLPRWPVTEAGKVDRAAVAELAAAGRLDPVPVVA
ncbi:AMP-binding protein [Petropleomorpha daqingensis]|uniref:Acyl-coenzyme A synthetase/AMP-(Fatty) acid ligase n=1 Tax=Petropleomorpha daqingensis TaxID=2026353 RepID=A0A853CJA6_9ACTN|nr:acyl-coenzyme A synthetase/AMP-(fatty) acid ligase [Petropleomorpha daqingensis]